MKYIKTFELRKKEYYTISNELINAVYHNNYSRTKRLLDSSFPVDTICNGGTPLLYAAYGGKWDIVLLLLKYNPDWYIKYPSGMDFIEYIEQYVGGDEVLEKIRKKYPEKYNEYVIKRNIYKYNL